MMRRTVIAVLTAALIGVAGGCGDVATRDFCTQYDDVVATVDELRSMDTQQDSVEDLKARAEELQAELDQLEAVSEGRLSSRISELRAAVNGFVNEAVAAGQDAAEAVRPALEDAQEEVREAWAVVEVMAVNECGESPSGA